MSQNTLGEKKYTTKLVAEEKIPAWGDRQCGEQRRSHHKGKIAGKSLGPEPVPLLQATSTPHSSKPSRRTQKKRKKPFEGVGKKSRGVKIRKGGHSSFCVSANEEWKTTTMSTPTPTNYFLQKMGLTQ